MEMSRSDRSGRVVAGLLFAAFLAAPTMLRAQEPVCEFEGSVGANTAAERFRSVEDGMPEAERLALFQEGLDAVQPELDGDNAVAYLMATQAHLELGNLDLALEYIATFDELAPECGEYSTNMRFNGWVQSFNMGIDAYSSGDSQMALEYFAGANKFQPDLRSYNNAALIHMELDDMASAIATYEEGLASAGDSAEPEQLQSAIRGLGDAFMSEGRGADAITAYQSYLESYPEDVVVRISYALALSDADRGAEAAEIFASVLSRDDLTTQQWVEVGVGLYNSSDFEGSATAFGKARAGNPFNKEAMENYVNASVQANRPGPVLALADTLVAWYPYDQENYQLLASALARADQEDRAMVVIAEQEAAELVFHSVQMGGGAGGTYVVRGTLEAKGASGTLTIPFEFLNSSGAIVASETLSMPAPAAGATERFELSVSSGVPIAGFRYGKSGS
jgi:tetratricopeptide (TPR) repeat protein